jgi:adenine-specific DNA-methyltransferase
LLRANLKETGLDGRVSAVGADFRSITLETTRGPTLFVGNPPYVRHHDIASEWKRWYVDACAGHGVRASQLAGAHLHFFAKIAELGHAGDYGCLITAAEWLDVGYGTALRSLLANGLGGVEVHLLEPTAEAFPGTMTTAAVTGFRIGRRPSVLRLRSVASPAQLERLAGGRAVDWSTLANTAKWSVFVRPSPKSPTGMIELGDVCRVHRGQVTGNNGVWIAGPETPDLPPRFLFPAVTRARELFELTGADLLRLDHLRRVIDIPVEIDTLASDELHAVRRFLKWAEVRRADRSYVAAHRRAWWSVGLREPPHILCTYMARRAPVFVRNKAGARYLNIAHGVYPRQPLTENGLAAILCYLNATVSVASGRTYAGGLVKFEPREIERLHIPGQLLPAFDFVSLGRAVDGGSGPAHSAVART